MTEPYITTFSGRHINLASPNAADIDIGDIAHALSLICRFNGHCRSFYSVAEHSVRVSIRAEELGAADRFDGDSLRQIALLGLMHDAAEAYPPGDIFGPLKPHLPKDKPPLSVQEYFDHVIRKHIDLDPFENAHDIVVRADYELLAWEWRDVMGRKADEKPDGIGDPHTKKKLEPWSSTDAEMSFLYRFQELAPAYPLHRCLMRLIPPPWHQELIGPGKGGWRNQLNHIVLTEAERRNEAKKPAETALEKPAPDSEKPVEVPHEGECTCAACQMGKGVSQEIERSEVCVGLIDENGAATPTKVHTVKMRPVAEKPKKRKGKKKRKRKRGKGFSAKQVEEMIANALDQQAVDSMTAPKKGAPGSSPDRPRPLPRQQNLKPTEADRRGFDDPDIRDREARRIKGGGGQGREKYAD